MLSRVRNELTRKRIIIFFFFALCFILFLFDLNSNKVGVNLLFSLFAFIIIGVIILLNYKFKKVDDTSYYKFYALAVFILGFILIVLTPPFMGSDEYTHFLRAYEISEGHFISKVDENGILAVMPRSLNKAYSGYDDENKFDKNMTISYDEIPSRLSIPLDKSNTLNYCTCNRTNYMGATVYSPFQYIPHLVGIEIGKIFTLGPTWLVYLARIGNLIVFALLTIIGIKLLPKFKLFAMLVLLSPVVLSGATTISADGPTNAVTFLFIAYIVNLICNKKTVRLKEKILLYLLAFTIAMCKIVYFPILALVFLIPKEQFKSGKDSLIFKITLMLFGLIFSVGWFLTASLFLNSQSSTSQLQMKYVFAHPLNFLFIVIRTYLDIFNENLLNIFFGNQMFHWSLKVYSFFSLAFVGVVVLSLFTKKADLKIANRSKILIMFMIIMILGLIASALFVQHNLGASNLIGGIQARYLIPLCFLVPLFLNIKKAFFSEKMVFMLFSFLYFTAFLTIVVRFI